MTINYVKAIGENWPGTYVSCSGDASVYDNINYEGGNPMPSKEQIDSWYADDVKLQIWKKIQIERDRRTQAGVKVTYNSVDYWFHSDQPSRIQQLGLVIMGQNLPAGVMWKTMSGVFIEMTPSLAGMIFNAVASKDIAVFTVAEQHKAQMYASSTPKEYNYLTGSPSWPLIYGE